MAIPSLGVRPRIPLTIVGGFLGSGKTTLLNHLITNAGGRRFAVIVNDFGAINIDARLIVAVEGETTIALTNGCICCVIRDDLVTEVLKLCARDDPPDHIIIESSGVAKPLGVVDSFLRPEILQHVELRTILTLLDADLAAGDAMVGEEATYADLAYAQIAVADLVVINKTDLVAPARVAAVRAAVERIVPRARILATSRGVIPVDLLFDHEESLAAASLCADGRCGHHHGHGHDHAHHHEDDHGSEHGAFAAWSLRDDARAFSFGAIQRFVEALPTGIYRAKGMVRLDLPSDDAGVLQITGRRGWLKLVPAGPGGAASVVTELVFIGQPGATTAEELRALLDGAWRAASDPAAPPHRVADLRAFTVEFV